MVLIHLKRADDNQFLFETTTSISVDALIRDLVAVHNTRLQILRLVRCDLLGRTISFLAAGLGNVLRIAASCVASIRLLRR